MISLQDVISIDDDQEIELHVGSYYLKLNWTDIGSLGDDNSCEIKLNQDTETNELIFNIDSLMEIQDELNIQNKSSEDIIITPIKSESSEEEFLCKEKFFRCKEPGCEFKTYHEKSITNHINYHKRKSILPYDCLYCCKKFKSCQSVNNHLRSVPITNNIHFDPIMALKLEC